MLGRPEFRGSTKGLPDLLNYAALVDDGVVLNKDGSLLAAWAYQGDDLDSASSLELAALSARVNAAFAKRGSGWMIHVDALRVPARGYSSVGAFPDRTTFLIDEERRTSYEAEAAHFESRYVLSLTYLPPIDAENAIIRFAIAGERTRGDAGSRALAILHAACKEMEDNLSSVLRMHRLGTEEISDEYGTHREDNLLRHLRGCIAGTDHPVRLPTVPIFLDALLGVAPFYGGLEPRVGRLHIRCVAIAGFPGESYPGILSVLNRLALRYRWSTRFIFLDEPLAQKHIRRYLRNWLQRRKNLFNLMREQAGGAATYTDAHADAMVEDAVAAMGEASSGAVKFGFCTSVIVLMNEDKAKAEDAARYVVKAVNDAGFVGRLEDMNAIEAFLGSLPGHGYLNVRRPLLHTLNLADILPLTSIWPGHVDHPSPQFPRGAPPLAYAATTGATPFRLNLHVSDLCNTVIFGPPGTGKSTLLGFLLAQYFRYIGARVFAFDKGYSLYALCAASGGSYYEIGADRGPSFMPLAHVDEPSERRWALDWLETAATLQGVTITPQHRLALHRALELLATSPSRTLTDFVNTMQDQTLRDALAPYTLAGPAGRILDADRDTIDDADFQVFELEHIGNLGEGSLVPVLLYLFHRIKRRLTGGGPTLVGLGEAWLPLSQPLFRDQVLAWLRTLRKHNAGVVLETQSVSDALNSTLRDFLIEWCPTKIYLPNPEATDEHVARAYESMGLSRKQIELIASAIPKRQYYYTSPDGRRLFDLGLGPIALSFLGAQSAESLATIRTLVARDPQTWPAVWLRSRGLSRAADLWMSFTSPISERIP